MKTILVIEDEPHLRANLLTILNLENFRALEAPNGRMGLALARRETPDLVLCDVMMPEIDGHAVLRALRSESATAKVPFIFMTAKNERADLRAGMDLGADDYVTKPFTVPELLAAIEARFRRAEQQQTTQFAPNFESPAKLEEIGLTPREAEVLFWVAQGKSNAEIGLILDMSVAIVKKHMEHVFAKLGVENRAAATLRALEVLNGG